MLVEFIFVHNLNDRLGLIWYGDLFSECDVFVFHHQFANNKPAFHNLHQLLQCNWCNHGTDLQVSIPATLIPFIASAMVDLFKGIDETIFTGLLCANVGPEVSLTN